MVNPECYVSTDYIQKSIALSLFDEFADYLKNMSGKCMDIGCGPGDITNILLPALDRNAVMIGTDISEEILEYANKTYGDEERLTFETLDIQTKSLPKKYISQFDHIFSFSVLMLCSDFRQAFENIYQMLKPGGNILVSFIAFSDLFDVLEIMTQDIRFRPYLPNIKDIFYPYFNLPERQRYKEVKELLTSIGFQVYHLSQREKTFRDKNSDIPLIASIKSVYAFLDKIPYDLQEEFMISLKNEYFKRKIHYKPIYKDEEITLDILQIFVIFAQKLQEIA